MVKALGFKTKEIELPDIPYGAVVGMIIAGEAGSIFEDFIRSGKVDQLADPSQIAGLKALLDVPAVDYLRAMRVRTLVQEAFRTLFVDVDIAGRTRPFGHRPERIGAAGSASNRTEAVVARIERLDSRGQSCGAARALASLRIRGRLADCDFAGGTAVLRESAPRHRERLPEPDGLAPPKTAAGD